MRAGEDDTSSRDSLGALTQRLDKWLWYARLIKSRTQAASVVADGKVRINRARVTKPSQTVRPGDGITLALQGRLHVLKVLAPGERRGPPVEARTLYEPLSPPPTTGPEAPAQAQRHPGAGRPSKKDRRLTDRLKGNG